MSDFFLRYCPIWLGNLLVRWKWGRKLLSFAEEEKPPILWIDESGGGWRHPPDWQEPHYEDVGQHDVWKREMRIFLWRVREGATSDSGVVNLRDVGLSEASRPQVVPRLWPVGGQVAEACRRLGFLRLAKAAMPEAEDAWLLQVWERHREEVEIAAKLAHDTIEEINRRGPVPSRTTPDEAAAAALAGLDMGPLDLPLQPGKYAPLKPIVAASPEHHSNYTKVKGSSR